MKTGIANLPLHYGSCQRWLFTKMVKLSRAVTEVIVFEFGPQKFLQKLSDPFFFQSLGCVLGFDWHSSGVTTTVTGALKEALTRTEDDLGIFICGGESRSSRRTPAEIENFAKEYSWPVSFAQRLIYASKMSAKIDNTALQDGYQLYHHTFIFAKLPFATGLGGIDLVGKEKNLAFKKP